MLWHPIADAPRDGSEVLCLCPGIGLRVLDYNDGWQLSGNDGPPDYEPTHFAFVALPDYAAHIEPDTIKP